MDIFIKDTSQGNLQNMTALEYKTKVQEIIKYIKNKYGIQIDDTNIKVNEIEINCTFHIEDQFRKYHRVLRLMMYNLPKNFKKLAEYGKVDNKNKRIATETFYRGNDSILLKIYDKTQQLNQKKVCDIQENLMRIEFVLRKSAKIKSVFGSNYLKDITDDKINQYFITQFIKVIENRYRQWEIENKKYLSDMIIQNKLASKKCWKSNLLRECGNREQIDQIPVLLDISHLLLEIKKMDKYGHYLRDKRGVLAQCQHNDVYLQKDGEKVEEIFKKVHEAYEQYQSTENLTTDVSPPCATICGDVA